MRSGAFRCLATVRGCAGREYCGLQWQQPLEPSIARITERGSFIQPDAPPSGCPGCGHKYMKWMDYEAAA